MEHLFQRWVSVFNEMHIWLIERCEFILFASGFHPACPSNASCFLSVCVFEQVGVTWCFCFCHSRVISRDDLMLVFYKDTSLIEWLPFMDIQELLPYECNGTFRRYYNIHGYLMVCFPEERPIAPHLFLHILSPWQSSTSLNHYVTASFPVRRCVSINLTSRYCVWYLK